MKPHRRQQKKIRSQARSAVTGQFVSKATAKRRPKTTVVEKLGRALERNIFPLPKFVRPVRVINCPECSPAHRGRHFMSFYPLFVKMGNLDYVAYCPTEGSPLYLDSSTGRVV
jgi:hypothetical protein